MVEITKKLNESKVLLICTTDNMIWQFLIPHVQDLISYGAKVDCVCSKTGFWFDELRDKFGFNMIEIPMHRTPWKKVNFSAYKTLKELQKQNNYNLIYCQQPVGGMMGRLLGKKFKVPVIYTAHGFFFFKGNNKLKNLLFKTAEKYLSKFTNVLITMNEEDFAASKKWKTPKQYFIHGIGIDENKYDNSPFDATAFKAELGLKEGDDVVLSVAEFIKRKNYPTMLKAFKELLALRPNAKYLVCGTGILKDEMQQLAKDLGIAESVKFLGYRKDINKIMQISNVFFHESFQEGLTMSIMEAMHFGLPVVTSNVRGNKDLIENNLGGIITECLTPSQQAEALNAILSNKQLANSMGEFNKNKVKNYYLATVREELKEIYKQNNLL